MFQPKSKEDISKNLEYMRERTRAHFAIQEQEQLHKKNTIMKTLDTIIPKHISLFYSKNNDNELLKDICCVCLNDTTTDKPDDKIQLNCKHDACISCMPALITTQMQIEPICPICRCTITTLYVSDAHK